MSRIKKRLIARACAAVALLFLTATLAPGGSIFDDDYKPAPGAAPLHPADAPPPPARLPPPPAPAAPEPAPQPTAPGDAPSADMAEQVKVIQHPRWPIPPLANTVETEKLLHEVFRAEYANRTIAGRAVLARLLWNEVHSESDAATEFVLLRETREAAAAAGNLARALEAVDRLRDHFAYSAAEIAAMEQSAITTAARNAAVAPAGALTPFDMYRAIRILMLRAEQDVAAGAYRPAADMASCAVAIARLSPECGLYDAVSERSESLTSLASEYDRTAASIESLKSHPNDPAANTAVGKFYAFAVDRPTLGLPMLAKGADPVLKQAATAELLSQGAQAGELGDQWSRAVKATRPGIVRDGMIRHAAGLYDSARANASGLSSLVFLRRGTDLRQASLRHGLRGDYFRGGRFETLAVTRVDSRLEFPWQGNPPLPEMPAEHFSVRWSGFLKAPGPGTYRLVIFHDDGCRLWIDGNLVDDQFGGARRDEVSVMLTGQLQTIKIDFYQWDGLSRFALGWSPPGVQQVSSIPTTALFHEPLQGALFATPQSLGSTIVLACGDAVIPTRRPRFNHDDARPPHLGDWESVHNLMMWTFDAAEGDYEVAINYAVGDDKWGSQYALDVGAARFIATVRNTDNWSDYRTFSLGKVHLYAGEQNLKLQALAMRKDRVMDLAEIRLTRLGQPAPTAPALPRPN